MRGKTCIWGAGLLCTRKAGRRDSSTAIAENQQEERRAFPAGISVRPAWFSILNNPTDSRNTANTSTLNLLLISFRHQFKAMINDLLK